jgi:hypothetical protein
MRNLPRTSASPAFTREVMRKLHRREEGDLRRPFVWRIAAAVAMAVCLIAVVNVAIMQQRQHARTLELRAEQQKIEAELEAVKQSARDAEPVVVLENDKGTRVIMDLDTAIQPAALHYD